jgi:hypothetical protein
MSFVTFVDFVVQVLHWWLMDWNKEEICSAWQSRFG